MAGWEERFDDYVGRLGETLGHADRRAPLRAYTTGLLLPGERKSVEPMAARVDPARVGAAHQSLHHFVAKAAWDDAALLAAVQAYALPAMLERGPVRAWLVDDAGLPKKGKLSVGVARQYCGQLGKRESCQVAVFLAYGSRRGHALIDRRLYLPEAWAGDAERRRAAKVPEGIPFLTKPEIARAMIARALDAGVPCGWVLGDEVYGADRRPRSMLEGRGKPYVLTIRGNDRLEAELDGGVGRDTPEALTRALPPRAWRRLSAGAGTKGERLFDWARGRPGPPPGRGGRAP